MEKIKFLHEVIGFDANNFRDNNQRLFSEQHSCCDNSNSAIPYCTYSLWKKVAMCDSEQYSEDHFVEILKYLHKKVGMTINDLADNNNNLCAKACGNNNVKIIEYLHKNIGFTCDNFRNDNGYCCELACRNASFDVIKYMHQNLGFTKHDFVKFRAEYHAVELCNIDLVTYLHQHVDFDMDDFKKCFVFPDRIGSEKTYLEIISYIKNIDKKH